MTRLLALVLFAGLALPAAAQTADPMIADTTATEPEFVANPAQARPLYNEALALGRAGTYDAALLKYDESLLHDPGFLPSLYGRAQALAQLGRFEDARPAYESAIAAARSANDARVLAASEQGLSQVETAIQQRAAHAAAQASAQTETQRVQAMTEAIAEATALLNAEPVPAADAQRAYDALERARQAGYDANLVAYYYARALLALDRGAEAVPYAQTAVDAADPSSDRSGMYVQLGRAQQAAGNTAAARAAFEAARQGQWSGWAEHYLRELGDG